MKSFQTLTVGDLIDVLKTFHPSAPVINGLRGEGVAEPVLEIVTTHIYKERFIWYYDDDGQDIPEGIGTVHEAVKIKGVF